MIGLSSLKAQKSNPDNFYSTRYKLHLIVLNDVHVREVFQYLLNDVVKGSLQLVVGGGEFTEVSVCL